MGGRVNVRKRMGTQRKRLSKTVAQQQYEQTASGRIYVRRDTNGEADDKPKKKSFFSDMSMASVIAGSLAAVTSLLLSSQIGITGSIIGVAVGGAVSTFCTQLYKAFLSRGAEKIHDAYSSDQGPDNANTGTGEDAGQTTVMADDQAARYETTVIPNNRAARRGTATNDEAAALEQLGAPSQTNEVAREEAVYSRRNFASSPTARKAAEHRRKRAQRTKVTRGVIVVSIISALVGVAVYAGIVNLATSGQGIGTLTNSTAADSSTTETTTTDSSQTSSTAKPSGTSGSNVTSNGSSTDSGTSTNSGSSDSSSTTSGSTSGSSSSTDSSSSTGSSTGSTSGSSGSTDSGTGSGSSSSTGTSSGTGSTDTGTTSGGTSTSTGSSS